MKNISLICVGKLKSEYWKQAARHYLNLSRKWLDIEIVELKDGDSSLSAEKRISQEGERILACLDAKNLTVGLSERGKTCDSIEFADLLQSWREKLRGKKQVFIVGGPFGLAPEVIKRCDFLLSLSAMTWPHELARVMLLEQLYRAQSIVRKTSYHHAN